MKPRRTHLSNTVLTLPGGSEDNDLWATATEDTDGDPITCSVWEPSPQERAELLDPTNNIELIVWGTSHPPVQLRVCNYPLGKPKPPPKPEHPETG